MKRLQMIGIFAALLLFIQGCGVPVDFSRLEPEQIEALSDGASLRLYRSSSRDWSEHTHFTMWVTKYSQEGDLLNYMLLDHNAGPYEFAIEAISPTNYRIIKIRSDNQILQTWYFDPDLNLIAN